MRGRRARGFGLTLLRVWSGSRPSGPCAANAYPKPQPEIRLFVARAPIDGPGWFRRFRPMEVIGEVNLRV